MSKRIPRVSGYAKPRRNGATFSAGDVIRVKDHQITFSAYKKQPCGEYIFEIYSDGILIGKISKVFYFGFGASTVIRLYLNDIGAAAFPELAEDGIRFKSVTAAGRAIVKARDANPPPTPPPTQTFNNAPPLFR